MNQTVSDYRFKFSVVTAVYNVEPYPDSGYRL